MGKGERAGGLGAAGGAINKAQMTPQIGTAATMGAPSQLPGMAGGPGTPYESIPMGPSMRKTPQPGGGIVGPPQRTSMPMPMMVGGMPMIGGMGGGMSGASPDRYGNPIGGMGGPSPDFWQKLMQSMAGRRIGGF